MIAFRVLDAQFVEEVRVDLGRSGKRGRTGQRGLYQRLGANRTPRDEPTAQRVESTVGTPDRPCADPRCAASMTG
jgi:hypothetical protein